MLHRDRRSINDLYLVDSISEVKNNVKQFNEDLEINDALVFKLSSFRHWYYIEELDLFGPSKFIGYKNNNSYEYSKGTNIDNGYMDGRRTQKVLKVFFKEVEDEKFESLYNKLKIFIQTYGKDPNKIIKIYEPICIV